MPDVRRPPLDLAGLGTYGLRMKQDAPPLLGRHRPKTADGDRPDAIR